MREHILYVRKPGAVFPSGKIEFGFYILIDDEPEAILNPFRNVAALLWEKWGEEEFKTLVSGYDSRQSLFAELIIRYGMELNRAEYVQRGLAALYASFEMMYCPENSATKELWEKTWPFFNEQDYGFMMENYGHMGVTSPDGLGIGEFTIYDWGNGAASEAYNRIVDHYGKDFEKLDRFLKRR